MTSSVQKRPVVYFSSYIWSVIRDYARSQDRASQLAKVDECCREIGLKQIPILDEYETVIERTWSPLKIKETLQGYLCEEDFEAATLDERCRELGLKKIPSLDEIIDTNRNLRDRFFANSRYGICKDHHDRISQFLVGGARRAAGGSLLGFGWCSQVFNKTVLVNYDTAPMIRIWERLSDEQRKTVVIYKVDLSEFFRRIEAAVLLVLSGSPSKEGLPQCIEGFKREITWLQKPLYKNSLTRNIIARHGKFDCTTASLVLSQVSNVLFEQDDLLAKHFSDTLHQKHRVTKAPGTNWDDFLLSQQDQDLGLARDYGKVVLQVNFASMLADLTKPEGVCLFADTMRTKSGTDVVKPQADNAINHLFTKTSTSEYFWKRNLDPSEDCPVVQTTYLTPTTRVFTPALYSIPKLRPGMHVPTEEGETANRVFMLFFGKILRSFIARRLSPPSIQPVPKGQMVKDLSKEPLSHLTPRPHTMSEPPRLPSDSDIQPVPKGQRGF